MKSETSTAELTGVSHNAIASLEYIQLNGTRQYLTIRGRNVNNPVLFYIHGGPGVSELPLIRFYNRRLENNFTIVYWEQRGTGISYSKNIPSHSFTIHQFYEDALELSRLLVNRFQQEKIYLMAHSWGTIIGTRLAYFHPELYHSYVGIGQAVNMRRGEELSYRFVWDNAVKSNNRIALAQLRKINNPPYLTIENNNFWFNQLKTERKWLAHFGGFVYQKSQLMDYLKLFLTSKEYSFMDYLRLERGIVSSIRKTWPDVMKIDFLANNLNFSIPVYFIQGIYDYNCPAQLVREYYNKITAPKKELKIFYHSAHFPNYEEHEKFNNYISQLII